MTPDPPAGGVVTPPRQPGDGEKRPTYRAPFAKGFGLALLVLALAVLLRPLLALWGISDDELLGDDADTALAALISLALVLAGGTLVMLGAWMAAVEWRGHFQEAPAAGDDVRQRGVDVPKLIEAVGKLRGAALVMVVGALLMLGAAWVAQSSAEPGAASGPAATS